MTTINNTTTATTVATDKPFRIIIAGGRDFNNYKMLVDFCDNLLLEVVVTMGKDIKVVCGMADGADTLGKKYADANKFEVAEYPAEWKKYGKSAGYRRNEQMAANADALIAFWDGISKGTGHMIDIAKSKGLPVRVCRYINGRIEKPAPQPVEEKHINGRLIRTYKSVHFGHANVEILPQGWSNVGIVAKIFRDLESKYDLDDKAHWSSDIEPACECLVYKFKDTYSLNSDNVNKFMSWFTKQYDKVVKSK
jgi:hypothetical protein